MTNITSTSLGASGLGEDFGTFPFNDRACREDTRGALARLLVNGPVNREWPPETVLAGRVR